MSDVAWENQSLRRAEKEIRNAVIERCAKVVLNFERRRLVPGTKSLIADEIRALKDEP